jgi:hypothetical protein
MTVLLGLDTYRESFSAERSGNDRPVPPRPRATCGACTPRPRYR